MFNFLLGLFSYDIAVDLGTANTFVGTIEKGIILSEKSCIALNSKTREVLAVGLKAYQMVGKTPKSINAIYPLQNGVISDLDACEKMLRYFISIVHSSETGFAKIPRPRAVISVPSLITEVEQRAVVRVAENAGIRKAYLIEEPISSAIGAGIDILDSSGNMIIDIGGGTTDIAVISLGGIVVDKTLRTGGNKMTEDIINYCKEKFNVLIGEAQAENAKTIFANVSNEDFSVKNKDYYEVRGRNLKTGLPEVVKLSQYDLNLALKVTLDTVIDNIKLAIEDTPPELVSDILKNGLFLVGGGAKLKGFAKVLENVVKVKVNICSNAETSVIDGNLKLLSDKKLLEIVKIPIEST